jgi:hypothetical protein
MSKILAAKHLSDVEYGLLLKVHAKHIRGMGKEARENYSLENIVKIKRNIKENCLNVYYSNGDWFHYAANGTWY